MLMQQEAKPRVSYAEFAATKQPVRTVTWVIERFIAEMNGTDGKPAVRTLGLSHWYSLKRLARAPIGSVLAPDLNKSDVIAHCRWRQAQNVLPQTVQQDVTYLTGALKYAGSAWDGCEDISDAAVAAAKPFLNKHQLICKSTPRDRRPQLEETARLLAYFGRPQPKRFRIDMVRMTLWQLRSSRRVGESCRLLWTDWNREDHTILVRKMKDPRNRDKSKVVALPDEAQAMLVEMWETRDPNEPRIHPFRAQSVSQAYTMAKKKLGIVDLHLHDSRRDCGTRLVEDKGFSPAEAICFTGHETVAVFERTYLRMKPELLKAGPLSKRMAAPA